MKNPSVPPNAVSRTLSVSSCRISRPGPAPNASRMAISFARAEDLTSIRLATFAQAISKVIATTSTRTTSGCWNMRRDSEIPRASEESI